MSYYIFSTLANDQNYTLWERSSDPKTLPVVKAKVTVRGKAGISQYKTFITPRGIVTEVSDEQYALLEQNHDFKAHVANGHIQVEKRKHDPEKIAQDMARDKSAPLTPDNYKSRVAVIPGTQEDERPTPRVPKKAA